MDGGMLSQDEISALLNGMSDGSADAADCRQKPLSVRQGLRIRSRLPMRIPERSVRRRHYSLIRRKMPSVRSAISVWGLQQPPCFRWLIGK